MNITIYSTPTCPFCKQVKDFFKKHDIEYKDIDVSVNQEAAQEMIQKSSQMGVPVIDIDGDILIGFDKEKLSELLHIES